MVNERVVHGASSIGRKAKATALLVALFSGTGSIAAHAQGSSQQVYPRPAESRDQWYRDGQQAVAAAKRLRALQGRAKNVILFIGDGMGISTVTAARILEGQLRNNQSGEENLLSFERLPYLALSKTYSVNQQTSDSAPTSTAMVTGVKTEDGILSVDQDVVRGDYTTVAGNELTTILELAEQGGLSTGVVSTARITHATPAAAYAHSPERDWEADANLPQAALEADFPDIARQLVEFPLGDGLEVALGGGRSYFLPNTTDDPEDAGRKGNRLDGRDLAAEWAAKSPDSAYVWNKAQFDAVNPATTDHLLGLFERSHMEWEHDRPSDTAGEPSLTEMTTKAIDVLAKNQRGYWLMVESGRIDHAHHAGNAYRALTDTIQFSDAILAAARKVNLQETLIIVTADHSHVFTIAGYPTRGNNILGKVVGNTPQGEPATEFDTDMLGLPYTTLSYANGPGYTGASNAQPEGTKTHSHTPTSYSGITAGRPDLTGVDTANPNYLQEAAVPLSSETHAGEEVGIYAGGPGAHLLHGVQEQNVIFHVMLEALRGSSSTKRDDE
jgi:alkaline phosphatase